MVKERDDLIYVLTKIMDSQNQIIVSAIKDLSATVEKNLKMLNDNYATLFDIRDCMQISNFSIKQNIDATRELIVQLKDSGITKAANEYQASFDKSLSKFNKCCESLKYASTLMEKNIDGLSVSLERIEKLDKKISSDDYEFVLLKNKVKDTI